MFSHLQSRIQAEERQQKQNSRGAWNKKHKKSPIPPSSDPRGWDFRSESDRQLVPDGWATIVPEPFEQSTAAIPLEPAKIPRLAHGLEKVLERPGIHYLKDPETGEYNFDPWLENICQPEDFDYTKLPEYMIASTDTNAHQIARKHGARYVSSTSSITSLVAKMYLHISEERPPNIASFSHALDGEPHTFTKTQRLPTSALLKSLGDGLYAVDADKSAQGDNGNIMQILGKSMELMLTAPPERFEKFTVANSANLKPEELDEDYHRFTKLDKFMLRAQMDCYDERLPYKTFDLKTRATLAVRMDPAGYKENLDYILNKEEGLINSFEREDYDMLRSAFLKYSFQARIGGMDGIFVCYHNTSTVFGFQYFPIADMDRLLFGTPEFGQQSFDISLKLLGRLLDAVTNAFPDTDTRVTMGRGIDGKFHTFAEPVSIPALTNIPEPTAPPMKWTLHTASKINDEFTTPLFFTPPDKWTVHYNLVKSPHSGRRLSEECEKFRELASGEKRGPDGKKERGRNFKFIDSLRRMAGLPRIDRGLGEAGEREEGGWERERERERGRERFERERVGR
ncbi:mitochondrial protein Pet127-domain-containing protein [Fimicolochytrium jonesii]|uniref:mitochondrial protein Pet127-domain-containing protein n=1 Tax=Fimicolochytrium jonesii TaxID=1396493 RepID=UPI0022FE7520|nr:mitochondrial protein Pet127-domain-containing protein [Fimicolochytrium jonesii]KAI8826779.1 mitochondrial protein Pet127-domain-containing protein [Fimicolochytrium jonesii]